MSVYTKRLEKALDLTLIVEHDSLRVDSLQPDCGDDYRMEFSRDESKSEIATRIGYEVLSWLELMMDEFDEQENDDDEE